MEHQSVTSSLISSIAHDGTDTLEVKFMRGGHYRYRGVTPEDFEALKTSDSIGKHFTTHIRGKFPHERLDTPEQSQ